MPPRDTLSGRTVGPTKFITRRGLLATTLAAALLAACGDGEKDETTASESTDGPWEFTDDRGVTISLPRRPERIVAQVTAAASLWNYGIRPIAVWGNQRNADGTPNIEVGNVDLNAVQSIGDAFGEFDLEKLASLRPDLVVSLYYSGDSVWFIPPEALSPLAQIAPLATIKVQDVPISQPIARFAELSSQLGADLTAKANVEAVQGFEKATADLKAAIASKPGLKVIVIAPGQDIFYVANPKVATDLIWFKELGMDIVTPDVSTFWENLSWEAANRYPADLILSDARPTTLQPSQLMDRPIWRSLPAVQAGQVASWPWKTYSHRSYTKALQELTATIAAARADVV